MNIVPSADGTLSRIAQARRILLTMALALASMLAITIAPPAHAQGQDEAQKPCPAYRICLYQYENYRGLLAYYAVGSRDMNRFGPRFDNKTSSITNRTPYSWCVYKRANYRGVFKAIDPGQSFSSLPGWNNTISSLKKC